MSSEVSGFQHLPKFSPSKLSLKFKTILFLSTKAYNKPPKAMLSLSLKDKIKLRHCNKNCELVKKEKVNGATLTN